MAQFIKDEGTHQVKITAIGIIQGRWNDKPDDMEVKVTGETAEGLIGCAYSELTMDYVQAGKDAGKQRYQATMDMLQELGLPSQDLSQLQLLIGKEISFYGKLSGGGHLNFYINTRSEKVVSPQDAAAKLNAMFGGAQQAAPQQQAAPAQQQQQQQAPAQQQQQGGFGANPFPAAQQGAANTNPFPPAQG